VTQVAEERGLPAPKALASTGLQPSDLTRSDLEIAAAQELTVIRNVLRWLGDEPGLGADAGVRMTLGMAGTWGFAMLNSATTREAIEVALRYGYGHLSFVFARPWVEERRNEVHIALDAGELPHDVRGFLIERDIAAQVALIPQLLGPAPPVRIETTLEGNRARHLASLLKGHEVVAGCGRDALILPAGILDRRLPLADEYALERWKQQCDALIARHADYRQGSGAIAAVRAAILRDPGHVPSLDEIARGLSVSPRTLRRQLADADSSFRSLLDEVRKLIAEDLLKSGAGVADVAYRMGYADTASFIRAFKRWTGRTPGTLARTA
jgi:AraC-like DNA-binding protein